MSDAATTVSRLRRQLRWLRNATRTLFTPVAIVSLVYFGWQSREQIGAMLVGAHVGFLVLAVIAWSAVTVAAPSLAWLVFRSLGNDMSYAEAARIHISNLPARYVPGGIWHTVGRAAGFRRAGVGSGHIAVFVFLENVLAAGVAFVIGGTALAAFRGLQGWGLIGSVAAGVSLLLSKQEWAWFMA